MTDKCRLDNGMAIRRPRRKRQQRNEIRLQACLDKYDDGTYTRIQYLRAVSHSVAHTDSLQLPDGSPADSDEEAVAQEETQEETPATMQNNAADMCEVCLLAPRSGVALVPCGHSRFCASCADTVTALGNGCPLCRAPINMVLRLFA